MSFFGQHINVFEVFLRLIARGKKGGKKGCWGSWGRPAKSHLYGNTVFIAFLLFLQTGFTACFSKTLKIAPILSFNHLHLSCPGRNKGLVTAFEPQCKSFGRKTLDLWFCFCIHIRADAQNSLGLMMLLSFTAGHMYQWALDQWCLGRHSNAIFPLMQEVMDRGALDIRQYTQSSVYVHHSHAQVFCEPMESRSFLKYFKSK